MSGTIGTSAGAAGRIGGVWRRLRPDWFILSTVAVVGLATVLPCRGEAAPLLKLAGIVAISSLFFLQGARLSREAIVAGVTHWRLHLAITGATFVLFPVLGLLLIGMSGHRLPDAIATGLMFVCVLPSTVQSSIALTSMARGNVAGAVCAASASNLIGMLATPLLLDALLRLDGGVAIDVAGVWKILCELFAPFIAGHLLRPRIGEWVERHRSVLTITDRGSILLVVYTAFSAAVVHGVWQQLPLPVLGVILVADVLLLAAAMVAMTFASRVIGMSRADEVAVVLCGAQKSLVTGVPMANAMFAAASVGIILLPIMIYYQLQLLVSAWLARRYAAAAAAGTAAAAVGSAALSPCSLGPVVLPQVALACVQPQSAERPE